MVASVPCASWCVALACGAVLLGCGGDPAVFVDAGADAARVDGQVPDAQVPDASPDASPDAPPPSGCADGTREGLLDSAVFPAIAACGGTWTGDVSAGVALCATGWHVCTGPEPALHAITYQQAIAFAGCFPYDAAQDSFRCLPDCSAQVLAGIDTAANIDLGAMGADCPYHFPTSASCLAVGRIDASENSGTGCDFNPAITTGVVCCQDALND